MQAVGALDERSNPYLWQMVNSLSADIETVYFTWKEALLGRYEVLHVHWPDAMMRGNRQVTTFAKQLLTGMLLLRCSLRGTPVVQTLHNPEPHESSASRIEALLHLALNRITRSTIALNEHTPAINPSAAFEVIPHGHYIDWFSQYPEHPVVPGRIVFVGLVRRYKGVPRLIEAFAALDDRRATLHVCGSVSDAQLEEELTSAAASDDRVTLALRHLTEREIHAEVTSAQVVALPYTRLNNSGAVLLALSLERTVLVPSTVGMEDLAAEVGDGWIHTYEGELTNGDLERALEVANSRPLSARPNLSRRGWSEAGSRLSAVYRNAVRSRTH